MLNDNKEYFYIDDYMYFTFNSVYSKKYNLFIKSDKKGFEWVVNSGASVKTEAPEYQNYNYYLGTHKKGRKFNLKLASEGLTQEGFKEMMLWLSEGETGKLSFDYNFDWSYTVVISKIKNPIINIKDDNTYIVEFDIEFSTIGDYRATGNWIARYSSLSGNNSMAIANKYGIPEIYKDSNTFYLPLVGDAYTYIDITFKPRYNDLNFKLEYSTDKDYLKEEKRDTIFDYKYNYNTPKPPLLRYNSLSGIITNNFKLLEQNNEVSGTSKPQIFDLKNTISSNKPFYTNYYCCGSKIKNITKLEDSEFGVIPKEYPISFDNEIKFDDTITSTIYDSIYYGRYIALFFTNIDVDTISVFKYNNI